jgi:hypothetical protein
VWPGLLILKYGCSDVREVKPSLAVVVSDYASTLILTHFDTVVRAPSLDSHDRKDDMSTDIERRLYCCREEGGEVGTAERSWQGQFGLAGFEEIEKRIEFEVCEKSLYSCYSISSHEILEDTLTRIEPKQDIIHSIEGKVAKVLRARLDWVRVITNIRRHHQSTGGLSDLEIILHRRSLSMRVRCVHDIAGELV